MASTEPVCTMHDSSSDAPPVLARPPPPSQAATVSALLPSAPLTMPSISIISQQESERKVLEIKRSFSGMMSPADRHLSSLSDEALKKLIRPVTISWSSLFYDIPQSTAKPKTKKENAMKREKKHKTTTLKDGNSPVTEVLDGPLSSSRPSSSVQRESDYLELGEAAGGSPKALTMASNEDRRGEKLLGSSSVEKSKGAATISRRVLLSNVTGRATAGSFLMIMGPSGCGKTTLLDLLADRLNVSHSGRGFSGSIMLNGRPRDKWFRRISCYVPQEPSLLGVLTVRETLSFAGKLYCDSHHERRETRDAIVEAVIVDMGLEDCANTRVGDIFFKGLSGGEKRRLSIGIELIKSPSLIFLDEPTSGLDSAAALEIVKHLKMLASLGHTIVSTVHQPSSEIWSLCDDVLFLSKGRTVFFGRAETLVDYLATVGYPCPQYTNPADFALSLINTDFPHHADVDVLVEIAEKSEAYGRLCKAIEDEDVTLSGVDATSFHSKYPTPRSYQFLVLCHRTFLDNLRNPGIFWVRLFMYGMLSLMIGTMYIDTSSSTISELEISGLLLYVLNFMVFMSVAALPFFIQERAVFVRERGNGMYDVLPYLMAKFFLSLPGVFLISVVCTAFIVPLAGMHGFGLFLLTLFLSLIAAESFMQLVGALVPNYIIGMALAAGLYGMFMLCEGYLITKENIPGYWIWVYYIAFHTYALRVFMDNEFSHSPEGQELLLRFDMTGVDVSRDLIILLAFGLGFQLLFVISVHKLHTGRR